MVPQHPDDPLGRLLRSLPRHQPPAVPLETILDRLEARKQRGFVLGVIGLAAALLLAVFLWKPARIEVPVHLDIRFVDVTGDEDFDWSSESGSEAQPQEMEGP